MFVLVQCALIIRGDLQVKFDKPIKSLIEYIKTRDIDFTSKIFSDQRFFIFNLNTKLQQSKIQIFFIYYKEHIPL